MTRVHLVGIAGAGQRAVAELLLSRGDSVSGSDVQDSAALQDLSAKGAIVALGHDAANVGDAEVLVVSSAVPETNPEIVEARARGILVIKNAQMLGALMRGKHSIAVAGTHGKTTTAGMLAWVMVQAGLDPDVIVGGELLNLGASGRGGRGAWFVDAADEYDRRFLHLTPEVAMVTNVEVGHLDYYGTETAMRAAFTEFVGRLPTGGLLVACADDPGCRLLASHTSAEVTWYGLRSDQNLGWKASDIDVRATSSHFCVAREGRTIGDCSVRFPGRHNVANALAAVAAATRVGLDFDVIQRGLASFAGTRRRFEVLGERNGAMIVTDYAHHPTEIRATIAAARQTVPGRIWACFQPHTYARTRLLMDEFVLAFDGADQVVIVGTYVPPGRETQGGDTTAKELASRLTGRRGEVPYLATVDEVGPAIEASLRPGDLVLLLGAGSIPDAACTLLPPPESPGKS